MGNRPVMRIGDRSVGSGYVPLVVAELGINHGGSLKVALQMVDAAKRAGVEVLKHQTHIVDDEMSDEARRVIPGNADKSIFDIMDECSLNEDDEKCLKEYVESVGMIFISTPFSRKAADRLEKLDVPAFKIGSGECNNLPLIEHIASFGKPIILSTGMNGLDSIKRAVEVLEDKKLPYALLHTTNLYPTPPEFVRLGAMVQLQKAFPKAVIGLSDHTTDNISCLGAVALGASLVERHFTDHMRREGPDICCSMDEKSCADLIRDVSILHKQLGGKKEPLREEQVTMDFAFATVVAVSDIKRGDVFSRDNIWVKRPGTGEIRAADFQQLLGARSVTNISSGMHLKWCDVDPDLDSTN